MDCNNDRIEKHKKNERKKSQGKEFLLYCVPITVSNEKLVFLIAKKPFFPNISLRKTLITLSFNNIS